MEQQSFMTNYIVTVSAFAEEFINKVAEDYNVDAEAMKRRYLYSDAKKFNKIMKKHKPKKPRKVTPYNIFLSDKKEIDQILENNNTDNQTKINRQKGDLWDSYKDDKNKIEKYNVIASLENKNLLSKNNRRDILKMWKTKSKILKKMNETENISRKQVMKKLNIVEI